MPSSGFPTYQAMVAFLSNLPSEVSISGLALGLVLVLAIFTANAFIIWAVQRDKRLRTRANVFLVSMALAEILTMLPRDIPILMTYARGTWQFGPYLLLVCSLSKRLRHLLAIFHVVAITFYRYVIVVHNKYYHYVSKRSVIVAIIVVIYTLPVVVVLSHAHKILTRDLDLDTFLFMNTKTMQMMTVVGAMSSYELSSHANASSINMTSILERSSSELDAHWIVLTVTSAVSVLLLGLYLHVYIFLRSHSKQLNKWAENRPGNTEAPKKSSHDVRILKTMAVVFLSFVLCYFLPVFMGIADRYGNIPHAAYLPVVLLVWSNSWMNCVIYAGSNVHFRRNLKMMCKQSSVDQDSDGVSTTGQTNKSESATRVAPA